MAEPIENPNSHQSLTRFCAVGLVLLWTVYCLNGFRPPTAPIELSDNDSGSALRQALFGGSALVSCIGLWMGGRVWDAARSHIAWVVLGAWVLASAAYSDEPTFTLRRAVLFWCGLLTAAYFAGTSSDRHLERAVKIIATLCTVAAGISLVWMALLPANVTTNPGRPGLAGVSNHPNTLAPACAIGLITLSGLRSDTRPHSVFRWVGVGVTGSALILTGSVTSMLLAVVGVLVSALLSIGGYATAIAVAAMFAAWIAMLLVGPSVVSDTLFASVNRDPSMSGRDELWGIIREQIQSRPLFGNGWGAFWTEGKGRELVGSWNPRQSHNAYLDLVLDIGFIGLILFVVPIGIALRRLRRTVRVSHRHETRQAAIVSTALLASLLGVYGLQQSFLGKPDSFAFAVVLWVSFAVNREPADGIDGLTDSG